MTLVLLVGPPGAGKGTQAAKIVEKYSWNWLSTGEALRKHIKEGTELGKKVQAIVDAGNLVSDELLLKILDAELKSSSHQITLLDGYPRNLKQAKTLDAMPEFGKVDMVLHFDVDKDTLVERIRRRSEKEGRADDTVEKFAKRLDIYQNDTKPVLKHYDDKDKCITIDADASVDEVFGKVQKIIEARIH